MLAKLIAYGPDRHERRSSGSPALETFRIDGVPHEPAAPAAHRARRDLPCRLYHDRVSHRTRELSCSRIPQASPKKHSCSRSARCLGSARVAHRDVGIPVRLHGRTAPRSRSTGSRNGGRCEAGSAAAISRARCRSRWGDRIVVRGADGRCAGRAPSVPGRRRGHLRRRRRYRFPVRARRPRSTAGEAGGGFGSAIVSRCPARSSKWRSRRATPSLERDLLLVLEAMKMEHRIEATRDGVIKSVAVAPGRSSPAAPRSWRWRDERGDYGRPGITASHGALSTRPCPDASKSARWGRATACRTKPASSPTADKIRYIDLLSASGLALIETTSFVRPSSIPQLTDAEAVMAGIERRPGVTYLCLVPNMRGFERAKAAGVRAARRLHRGLGEFTKRNINMTIDESLATFRDVVAAARPTACGCAATSRPPSDAPIEGRFRSRCRPRRDALAEMGIDEISIGDTIGVATPNQVVDLRRPLQAHMPVERLAMHFHDTRGTALANVLAALQMNVAIFDSSSGGARRLPVRARRDRKLRDRRSPVHAARHGHRNRRRARSRPRRLALHRGRLGSRRRIASLSRARSARLARA
jgi:hydroxymethylglutaryl-CoA lyase